MSRSEQQSHSGEPSARKEQPVMVQADLIPTDLKEYPRPQWVCWRYAPRGVGKKPDKKPINAKTLGNAGPYWPNSWSTFDTAYATYLQHQEPDPNQLNGIGFYLSEQDDFVAVDLDNCISREEGVTSSALEVIQALQSYSEVSPSGHGIRILVSTPAPVDNFKSPELEIYSHKRYVTITGHRLDNSPQEINRVDPRIFQSLRPPEQPPHTTSMINTPFPEAEKLPGRADLTWEQIFRYDKYGQQHLERFNGNLALDGNDHSLCVLRLLNCLARWSGGDSITMRRLMLQTPLANDKWWSRRGDRDWLDVQITDAINYVNKGKQR